jgi:integrase
MARNPGTSFPPYPRKAHSSGQARIRIAGRHVYLGVWQSPASWLEYRRRLAAWQEAEEARKKGVPVAPAVPPRRALTVGGLVAQFMTRGAQERYYDADGQAKPELGNFPFSLAPLLAHYRHEPVADFGAPQLKQVLRSMIRGDWMTGEDLERAKRHGGGRGWARALCNRSLSRIKLLFGWGESEGLVPEGKSFHLATVAGLEVDQGGARETDDRAPVPQEVVDATLPHMNHVVAAMVRLLVLTAARPKEIRELRPRDIDRSGRIEAAKGYWVTLGSGCWAVRLRRHKTAHKKQRRIILFGPEAQTILEPFLRDRPPDQFLFSPQEAMRQRAALRRSARRTRVQPSQRCRRKATPDRAPGDHYTRTALQRSIAYAAAAAKVPHWAPYQLRHLASVNLIRQFGWDVARVILGHTEEEMTRRYGIEDLTAAAKAMGEAG